MSCVVGCGDVGVKRRGLGRSMGFAMVSGFMLPGASIHHCSTHALGEMLISGFTLWSSLLRQVVTLSETWNQSPTL